MDKKIYELHAEVCKTLSNAKRLEILNCLRENELNVNDIVNKIGAPKANISQHLAIMRLKGIVTARRAGNHIFYRVLNPKVIKACDIMREVLFEQLSNNKQIARRMVKSEAQS